MAGKNHHIVPRFAQRGFLAEASRKKSVEKTWVYRKNGIFLTELGGSGAENYFYGGKDYTEVDDLLTTAESSEYAITWNKLRAAPPGAIAGDGLPNLIAHFELRSRQFREASCGLVHQAKELLFTEVNDADRTLQQYAQMLCLSPWKILPPELGLRQRLAASRAIARMPQRTRDEAIARAYVQLRDVVNGALSNLDAEKISKAGHLAALKRSLPTPLRANAYTELEFRLVRYNPDEPIILGDSVVMFAMENRAHPVPFLTDSNHLAQVIIPVAHDKALIGGRGPIPSAADIRNMAARCAHTQFTAHADFPEARELQGVIGEWAALFPEEEVSELFEAALRQASP